MKKSSFSNARNCLKPLLKKGVENGVFSGAAVGLYAYAKNGEEKVTICQGKTRKDEKANTVDKQTFFDLASLTKPLCTVMCILNLIERRKITLDTRLEAIGGIKTGPFLKKTKIANLLSHSSGLRMYEPFYRFFDPFQKKENKNKLLSALGEEKLIYSPGKKCVYSDLGYLLLGEIVEQVSGQTLNHFFSSTVTQPLGLDHQVMFRPLDEQPPSNVAATQDCPWRKRILQGEVDDEHSWLMEGVAGHAGVFGTIQGTLDMCAHVLNLWKGREKAPCLSKALLEKALTRQYKGWTWCLGFDTPSLTGSSAGSYVSRESVGHLGFTGTSFWIDPKRDMVIVLLTNRVHPDRGNEKIKEFRPLLHDAIYQALLS